MLLRLASLLLSLAVTAVAIRGQGTTYNNETDPAVSTDLDTTGNNLTLTGSATGTFSGAITGSGSVTKDGNGSWTLSAGNSYIGGTFIEAGTLTLSGDDDNAGVTATVASGGTLLLAKQSTDDVHALGANGTGLTIAPGGTAQLAGTGDDQIYDQTDVIVNGTFDLAGRNETFDALSGSGTITNSSAATTSILSVGFLNGSGVFSGTLEDAAGTLALTKLGTGTLTLSGTNTYSGGTTLSGGTLALGSSAALGSSGTITLDGGTLQYSASNNTDYSNRFSTASGQTYRIDTNGRDVTFASALTSADAALIKTGTGTLTLSGNNTFTGGTTLAGGTLALGHINALGPSGTLALTGGTLQFSAVNTVDYSSRFSTVSGQTYRFDTNGEDVTFATALTSADAALIKSGTGTLILAGDNTYAGGTTVLGGTLQIGTGGSTGILPGNTSLDTGTTLIFDRSGDLTHAGEIGGFGSLVKNGSANLTLSGPATYTGGTTVNAGTLTLTGSTDNLGNTAVVNSGATLVLAKTSSATVHAIGANGSGLTINTGGTVQLGGSGGDQVYVGTDVALNGTLDLAGRSEGFDALTGSGTITNSSATTSTLTVGQSNGSGTFSGLLENGSGTLAVVKVGSGTLALTTPHTYSGGTQIDGGTVNISNATGSAFGSGLVTIGVNGTLTGSGSFSGGLVNDGIFSPGAGVVQLTLASFSQGQTGELILQLGGDDPGQYDAITINGAAAFDGALTLSLLSYSPGVGDDFDLFAGTAPTGTFDAVNLPPGFEWDTSQLYSSGIVTVTGITAVPEPSTYAALFGALALGFATWRRRNDRVR